MLCCDPVLGGNSGVSSIDPSPLFPLGHGLSYTTFDYADLELSEAEIATDGELEIACTITHRGARACTEIV